MDISARVGWTKRARHILQAHTHKKKNQNYNIIKRQTKNKTYHICAEDME